MLLPSFPHYNLSQIVPPDSVMSTTISPPTLPILPQVSTPAQTSSPARGLIRSFTLKQSINQPSPPVIRRTKPLLSLATRRNFQENLITLETERPVESTLTKADAYESKSRKEFQEALKRIRNSGLQANIGKSADVLREDYEGSKTYGMSVMDLWGPDHTRKSLKAMGLYQAFKKIESREKRINVAIGGKTSERYMPRLAEDLSTMRMYRLQPSKSTPHLTQSPSSPLKSPSKLSCPPLKSPSSTRLRSLNTILESCSQLEADNQTYMRELEKMEFKKIRKRRVQRSLL